MKNRLLILLALLAFALALGAGCVADDASLSEVQSAVKPPPCPVTKTCPVPTPNGGWAFLMDSVNTCSPDTDIVCHWNTGLGPRVTHIDVVAGCEICHPTAWPELGENCDAEITVSSWTCEDE